ncbi:MAG: hypothetical protein A2513_08430 [Sulfurimonas sp. RIFOXYD12_FULL_33_39]|uniref:hypothetical protein n=1 Tax=unclassified Sulfurimonas TaxID=2623549 RepID=UPI0008ACE115|nr:MULTISPECIES: hypothetical protein [unclassified Sulfurimonas]OHE10111.1 MAG: hypothetical protein A2513_08430 [Sulfurimonas sp. RIFOXYD12_FULL_33_39]OHE14668.1 MAG: hypothetical protein A2530_02050 [Sulfurimonas sp. RIFOXYD2_FULL_34_21]DAB28150.1 MAG TPA: hypothetical protein CFH78_04030 [Sulfurimonas sp. UBA10385]
MKAALIVLLAAILSNTILCATQLQWVDEQVEAIKPPRKGIDILTIESPFVFLEKNKSEIKNETSSSLITHVESSAKSSQTQEQLSEKDDNTAQIDDFNLNVIINSSAMINGNWYRKDDIINNYTIANIDKNSVTLKKENKKLVLSTYVKNSSLKFKNK